MTDARTRPVRGILLMVATGLMFVAVTAVVKHVGDRLPAPEMAFLRYLLGIVFLVPMIGPMRAAKPTSRQVRLLGIRGLVHAVGVMLWFFAMTRITIAEVTAMNYMAPIYVTIGAALFLGERLAARRIIAVVVAFLGALVILRPGFRELSDGHIAMLFGPLLLGSGYLIAKQLSSEMPPAVIVGFLSVIVTVALAPVALAVWVQPTWTELAWLFLVAFFATAGHYLMTMAFAAAPVTVTQPVSFLQLVWATLLGAVLFAERIDPFVILGGIVILASVTFITWREYVLSREPAPSPGVH